MHALTFGAINLIGTAAELTANGYKFEALADETDYGNPVPIEQKIISWLQDGALLALNGYDNRDDMLIRIRITGADANKLAIAEQALVLETGGPNTLIWTPPDAAGQPCVFDVVMSNLEHSMDDLAELRLERIYTLRIQALPFARAQDLTTVTVPAPTGTQTITSIDTCSSFTNWAATCGFYPGPPSGTLTSGTSGGKVFAQLAGYASSSGTFTPKVTRSSLSASISTTPYIRVVVTTTQTQANLAALTFMVNGTAIPVAVQEGSTYWLDTTGYGLGTTMTSFSAMATFISTNAGSTGRIDVDDLSRSNFLGTQATNRQLARTLPIAGSARTQGNLALADAANSLGDVLVYTCPTVAGLVQPNLRQFLTSGNAPTGDSTTVSGFTSDASVLHTFDVPETGLLPGGYQLLARVKHASSGARTLTWAAKSRMGSTNLGDSQSGTASVTLTAGVYSIVTVASMVLPPKKIGTSGLVRIELTAGAGVTIDEAWLFNVEAGRLTQVACGSAAAAAGGSANRLWLDAPSLASPVRSVYLGFSSDRSDQYHAGLAELVSAQTHEFEPTSMNIFTVTTNSTAAAVTLSHYRRSHTHVVA